MPLATFRGFASVPRVSRSWQEDFVVQDVPFPSTRFRSLGEFQAYRRDFQSVLDGRWLHEQSLASDQELITIEGTCSFCLSPARFAANPSRGERLANGLRLPNWREELACDCAARLINRRRAVLHFLESEVGLHDWTQALALGQHVVVAEHLRARVGALTHLRRLERSGKDAGKRGFRLDAPDRRYHLAVALDVIQNVPPLDELLGELARVLVPGGSFVFTVPFRHEAPKTTSYVSHLLRLGRELPPEFHAEVHEIGWDVLDRLQSAGFSEVGAYLYWSEEFGFLGPFNFVFLASR